MKTVEDLRQQADSMKELAKQKMSENAAKTLTVCLDELVDDFEAILVSFTKDLENTNQDLKNGSNDLKTAVTSVKQASNEMQGALNDVVRLTKDLSVASIDTYKEQKATLEENIKQLEEKARIKRRDVHKASFEKIWEAFKTYSLVLIGFALIVFLGVQYEASHVTDEIITTISHEYESMYSTFQKREEIQKSVEAWDEYHAYCLKTYVECPWFGSCEEAQQRYTDEVFIPKFGNRPGTVTEE